MLFRSLAEKVVELAEGDNHFQFVYNEEDSIETKLNKIVTKVYGGKGVRLTPAAKRELKELEELGFSNYPICMAKTQYSFSDDAKKLGAPKDFVVTISQLKVSAGAGFIVALTGAIMTIPGLPKMPAFSLAEFSLSATNVKSSFSSVTKNCSGSSLKLEVGQGMKFSSS